MRGLCRGKFNYHKAKRRSGLCNYCRGWELDQQPVLQKLWSQFLEETTAISVDFWADWPRALAQEPQSLQLQHRPLTCQRWWKAVMAYARRRVAAIPLAVVAVERFCNAILDKEAGAMRIIEPLEGHLRLWDNQVAQFQAQFSKPWPLTLHAAADYSDR